MRPINQAQISFSSHSVNEGFGRAAVAAFLAQLDPTVADLSDMRTAVSEAVTNAIVHGYREQMGTVYITVKIFEDGKAVVRVRDKGCGIPDVKQAMEPLFTTGGEERAGLGFAVMQSFCDSVRVSSTPGRGTSVTLVKRFEPKA
ncbi:anti-sigma F factor [Oscillospiraceae bacterium 42-9]|jgi:stage II sporulation protein AB (anti-sigma F factor)|uniref:anti-sigma F factor n=1 Tax=Acutalibacter sp. TaxID=1918636 RepID=UPI00216C1194|nr:anti-sigma F factor [Acutalibacter sp.]